MYVYFYFGEDSRGQDNLLLYIGTSRDVVARFNQHKYENADWVGKVKAVAVRGLYEGDDALRFERHYIGIPRGRLVPRFFLRERKRERMLQPFLQVWALRLSLNL